MANGVNVKMGVSGVAQFKQAMKQAQTSVKTLDAELALNEKQFKASGDSEQYLEQKAELLNKKLEEQKSIVANAEKALDDMNKNGVDKASTAYQNMQQALANAKGNLLDTETQLGNIGTAATDAETNVSGMADAINQINTNVSLENVNAALGKVTDFMGGVIEKAWEVGKAITRDVLGAGSWADDLATKAKNYRMSTDELQRWEKTAEIIDTSVESIVGAKRKLTNNLSKGMQGDEGVLDMLKWLKIDGVDQDPEEMFWKVGEAIMAMGDAYTQEQAAQKLFGKSWHELIPLFEEGRESVEELNKSWNVVPQDQIDALTEMDDNYKKLQFEIDTVRRSFEAQLAPAITEVTKVLTGLVEQFNQYMQTEEGKEMMESLSKAVTNLFGDLKNIDTESVMNSVIGAVNKLKEGLDWFSEHGQTVVSFAEGFVAAWMGLKLTSGIAGVLQLVNGVRGLMGGGSVPTSSHPTGAQGTNIGSKATQVGALASSSVGVGITSVLSKGAAYATANSFGQFLGPLYDRLLNETNAGRALRDGGNVWEGLSQDISEKTAEIEQNASTFFQDWGSLLKQVYGLSDPGMTGAAADEWDEYEADLARRINDDVNKPAAGGGNYWNTLPERYASLITDKVAAAITEAMEGISVQMDGQEVGAVVSPYVNAGWGGLVVKMTK